MSTAARSRHVAFGCLFRRDSPFPLLGLAAAVVGVSLLVMVQPKASASTDAVFYSLDMEATRIDGDFIRKDKDRSKGFQIKREGGGRLERLAHDEIKNSTVLVITTDATPEGKIKDRSEVQLYSGVEFGKQWALGMSVFIPAGVQFTDNWHLLAQCHQGGALHPPLSLNLIPPQKIAIVARNDKDNFEALHTMTMPTARWVRIELEFTMGERGHIGFWMDGQLAYEREAMLRFKNGVDRCSLKVGTYRGQASTPHEVRFDDIRFGSSRAAISLH